MDDIRAGAANLADRAYNAVSTMIRERQLRGGEIITEARLAEQLKISRTPLREALQRLEGEGLVLKRTGRSFVARHVDLREYLQSLKVREILEAEAAGLAVGHIPGEQIAAVRHEIDALKGVAVTHTHAHWLSDDNLHGLYIDHCGNEVLGQIIRNLRVTTRLFEIARLSDRIELDECEHLAILAALEKKDSKAARKEVRNHIHSLTRSALETVL